MKVILDVKMSKGEAKEAKKVQIKETQVFY